MDPLTQGMRLKHISQVTHTEFKTFTFTSQNFYSNSKSLAWACQIRIWIPTSLRSIAPTPTRFGILEAATGRGVSW